MFPRVANETLATVDVIGGLLQTLIQDDSRERKLGKQEGVQGIQAKARS